MNEVELAGPGGEELLEVLSNQCRRQTEGINGEKTKVKDEEGRGDDL